MTVATAALESIIELICLELTVVATRRSVRL